MDTKGCLKIIRNPSSNLHVHTFAKLLSPKVSSPTSPRRKTSLVPTDRSNAAPLNQTQLA